MATHRAPTKRKDSEKANAPVKIVVAAFLREKQTSARNPSGHQNVCQINDLQSNHLE